MKKREEKLAELQDHMAENDSALMGSLDLMQFIEGLRLSTKKHNQLVRLIDSYREECEQGAYIKGAKEKPCIEEHVNGKITAIYNDDSKNADGYFCEKCRKGIRAFADNLSAEAVPEYLTQTCCDQACCEAVQEMGNPPSEEELSHEEMLDKFQQFYGKPFTMADFRENYEMYLPDGDCEEPEWAADMRRDYPNLCDGKFNEAEWVKYVEQSYIDACECVPDFPRD